MTQRLTAEQIIGFLKEADTGAQVTDLADRELRLLHAEPPLTRKFYFSDRLIGGGITR